MHIHACANIIVVLEVPSNKVLKDYSVQNIVYIVVTLVLAVNHVIELNFTRYKNIKMLHVGRNGKLNQQ